MSELPDKIPLGQAAADLTRIADLLEETGDITEAMLAVFGESKALQAAAVDRNFMFHQYTKSMIAMAKEMEENWRLKRGFLTNVMENHKVRLKHIIEQNDNIPFQGKQGKIALQKSPAAMNLAFPTVRRTYEMISEDCLTGMSEERKSRYFPKMLINTVDREAIKEDLKAGNSLPFATLTQDNHVRFRI